MNNFGPGERGGEVENTVVAPIRRREARVTEIVKVKRHEKGGG